MKLVVDNDSNIAELPVGNLMDVADMARRFAGDVEAGDYGDVFRTLAIVETPEGLTILGWGENTTTHELMGLFEHAKLQVFADFVSND